MSDYQKNKNTKGNKKSWVVVLIVTILALLALVGSIMYTKSAIKAKKMAKKPSMPVIAKPSVTYRMIQADSYASQIMAFGETKAKYQLDLTTDLQGKIQYISKYFNQGRRVKKDQILVELATTDYEKQIASKQATIANTELRLLEEKRKQKQAKYEWAQSGLTGQPDSELVFREPQIKTIQATLIDAKLALKQSQQDLKDTKITAPFDAIVVMRQVQPGSLLRAGQVIGTLNSTDTVEIALPLTQSQWAQLPSKATLVNAKWPVTLYSSESASHSGSKVNPEQAQKWRGYVTRVGQSIDEKTRQRPLIVAVDKPLDRKQPLFAGSFVKAVIDGQVLDNLWKIPATALSQTGDIWLLDDKDCLIKQPFKQSYSRGNALYMPIPASFSGLSTKARLVLSPLNSFVSGMCVTAINESVNLNNKNKNNKSNRDNSDSDNSNKPNKQPDKSSPDAQKSAILEQTS